MACRNAFISLTDATRLTVRFVDYTGIRTRRQMVRSLDCIFLLTLGAIRNNQLRSVQLHFLNCVLPMIRFAPSFLWPCIR